ncbi:MAG: hypothetical protein WC916_06705 [Candidatus Woesearchaeota archaeon]
MITKDQIPQSTAVVLEMIRSFSTGSRAVMPETMPERDQQIKIEHLITNNHLEGLAYLFIKSNDIVVNDELRGRVEKCYAQNSIDTIYVNQLLKRLSKDIEKTNAAITIFEGSTAILGVLNTTGVRPVGTIRLLSDYRSLKRAHKILTTEGFRTNEPSRLSETAIASALENSPAQMTELPFSSKKSFYTLREELNKNSTTKISLEPTIEKTENRTTTGKINIKELNKNSTTKKISLEPTIEKTENRTTTGKINIKELNKNSTTKKILLETAIPFEPTTQTGKINIKELNKNSTTKISLEPTIEKTENRTTTGKINIKELNKNNNTKKILLEPTIGKTENRTTTGKINIKELNKNSTTKKILLETTTQTGKMIYVQHHDWLHRHKRQCRNQCTDITVELCTDVAEAPHPFYFSKTNSISHITKSAYSIDFETTIVISAAQLFIDKFKESLLRLFDLAVIVNAQIINWKKLIEISRETNTSSFTYIYLLLGKELLDLDIPPEIIDQLRLQSSQLQLFFLDKINYLKLINGGSDQNMNTLCQCYFKKGIIRDTVEFAHRCAPNNKTLHENE